MTLEDDKARMRAEALARRPALHEAQPDAGQRACRHFLSTIGFPAGVDVSAYLPVNDEFDVMPFAATAHAFGHRVGMPVVTGKAKPLQFRQWTPETVLETGVLGIPIPPADADVIMPRLLLVPLMAFDARGYRLGYGGGFYDRTLARLRALKPIVSIGIAFDEQQVDAVPHVDYDERLDWILTPSGPLKCETA